MEVQIVRSFPRLRHEVELPVGSRHRLEAPFSFWPRSGRAGLRSPPVRVAVRTHELTRRFDEVLAVDAVDLEVGAGEIYGFLGPNGAGKSTLVRMLCTLLLPTAGTAEVVGFDVVADPMEVRLRIGVALQDAALDAKLTGRELLMLQGRVYGLAPHEAAARVDELAPFVDMDAIDRRISTYSGGMRRRLDLAAALIHNPQVVFLDEPKTGLDPDSRARVWTEIRRLRADVGVTVFLTTQYLEEADLLADRVGIIRAGRVVAEGAPAVLKRELGTDLVLVVVRDDSASAAAALAAIERLDDVATAEAHGCEITASVTDGAAALSPIALALSAAGVDVVELGIRTPTLDDVFLEVTGDRFDAGEAVTRT